MTTWWAMPTYQQETCWTNSLRPTATSQQSTCKSTLNTCAEPGIPSNQWRLCSSRFKTVLTIRRQEASPSVPIGPSQQINLGYAKILATWHFMIACHRWNEKPTADKTWTHFKSHFTAVHRQHKQMQEETAANAVYHSANSAMTQTEDQMAEATIGALANLATTTASDRGVVEALTQANSRCVKQLEEKASKLREFRALLHQ
jgi:hypothetical protein